MKTELTDWYPNAEVKPVRAGWYQVKWEHGGESDYNWWWTGFMWYHTSIEAPQGYVSTWVRKLQSRPFFWRGQTHA